MNRLARIAACVAIGLGCALGAARDAAATQDARVLPDLGLVINVDGDNAFPAPSLDESTKLLRAEVDRYADARVKTLCYSVAAGSDIMLYPTRVADTWGWRSTKYDVDPAWEERIKRMRSNMQQGGDALRTAGTRAKERGMLFIPSQRMNDAHFAFGKPPEDYPLTGRFWLEHRDMTIGTSPVRARAEYGHVLDFSRAEVRQYRLAQIEEAIDRYADLLDGFELDFTRFQVFFPAGRADEGAPLMTELVAAARAKLDAVGRARGRSLVLIARIPPAPANCRWAGLDVQAWIDRRLVDVLVPSHLMTTGFEQPVDEFKKMAGSSGIRVYSTLMPRVNWGFPFVSPDSSSSTTGTSSRPAGPDRELTVYQLRAAALNAYHLGADGVYLFNFAHYPSWFSASPTAGKIDLTQRDALRHATAVFSVSKSYFHDDEDGYEYRKQLPAPLTLGRASTFQILVGEVMSPRIVLRIGLRNPPADGRLRVKLNGEVVLKGLVSEKATRSFDEADAKIAKQVAAQSSTPTHFAMITIDRRELVRRGTNAVEVSIDSDDPPADRSDKPASVTDVDIGMFFE